MVVPQAVGRNGVSIWWSCGLPPSSIDNLGKDSVITLHHVGMKYEYELSGLCQLIHCWLDGSAPWVDLCGGVYNVLNIE